MNHTTSFIKQFTGRECWLILCGLIALDLLSFITLHTSFEAVLFGAVAVSVVAIAWKKPEWLFPLAIAEIISTSNGHSADIEIFGAQIGVRILIFAILMLATLWRIIRRRENPIPRQYRLVSLLLVTLLIYGILRGVFGGYEMKDVYLDANGYLAIGYVFAAWVWTRDAMARRRLLQAIGAGVTWIAAKTLLFLFAFGHLHPKTLDPLYLWIRDTRLGEITIQRASIYRVFLQAQWYLIPAIMGAVSYMFLGERKQETGVRVVLMLVLAALIASLSRSFGVALLVSGGLLVIHGLIDRFKPNLIKLAQMGVLSIASLALLWSIVAVPIFQTASIDLFGALRDRTSYGNDVAIDSRQKLLGPLNKAILAAPATGHGLGKLIWYQTSDPRYIDDHETDIVATYALEWGWHDIWVKFGVIGVFAMLLLFIQIMIDVTRARKADRAREWLYVAVAHSVIALYVVHIFTPYLNHPLGWGTIAVAVALLPGLSSAKVKEGKRAKKKKILSPQPTMYEL